MENYKEKYEQALDDLMKIKNANKDNKELVDFIEHKYPELELKEDEDLDKEIQYMYKRDNSTLKTEKQYAKYAKHFFKLGLKAQKGE